MSAEVGIGTGEALLERYLQAVGFWLPKEQRQDILAELSVDLRSQMEDREGELGRELNEADVAAILKQLGRPVFVANRYLPQRSLIGPVLFPIYRLVLKIVGLWYLLSTLAAVLAVALYGHGAGALFAGSFGKAMGSIWSAAVFAFCAVTLIFAVLERSHARWETGTAWDPRKLPAVRDPRRISRSSSVFELAGDAAVCAWWIGLPMEMTNGIVFGGIHWALAPAWRWLSWGVLLVPLGSIALAGANVCRPYWTRLRAILRLLTDGCGAALFCWFLRAAMVRASGTALVTAERAAGFAHAINAWLALGFWPAVLLGLLVAVLDVRRLARLRGEKTGQFGRPGGSVSLISAR